MSPVLDHDLVLNAADGILQIVVLKHEDLVLAQTWFLEHRATEILASALESLCRDLDIPAAAFRRIACVNGPGSFTGIRLVLSTAAALRRCHATVLGAINGLQALAWDAVRLLNLPEGQALRIVTHARRELVHTQSFTVAKDGWPEPTRDLELLPPEDVVRSLAPGETVCGNGIGRNWACFQPYASKVLLVPGLAHASAEALAQASAHARYADADLEPLYVRPCDALDNLERLARRQGMAADWAKERLHTLLTAEPHSSL